MKQLTQNKPLVLFVAFLLLANIVLLLYFFVFKKEHSNTPAKGQGSISEYVKKELGLSAEQSDKFKQLRDQHLENVKPVATEMQKLKDSLYSMLKNPATPDSVVTSLASQIASKQEQIEVMTFHHLQRVRVICDSSQLEKFDKLVHQMINRNPWLRKRDSSDRKK